MKYGDLVIECLAVLDEIYEEINIENIENFKKDESYSDLFVRIPGSINRAMDRIANRRKFPLKTFLLTDPITEGNYLVFNLNKIPQYRNIKRVTSSDSCNYIPNVEYIIEGKTLMISREYSGRILKIIYFPGAPAISSATKYSDELDIPDELARIIPYYVKSDIMSRDEPALATQARNKFEEALDEINLNEEDSFAMQIEKVYRMDY